MTPPSEHLDQIIEAQRVQPLDRGGVRGRIKQLFTLRQRQICATILTLFYLPSHNDAVIMFVKHGSGA